jgi:B9 domain-containing protein 1
MMISEHTFHISICGQIESATFALGTPGNSLFCRYDIVIGPDWELVSGLKSGITQCAQVGRQRDLITFNMPLEATFKSTNPYGWPQIVFSIYGSNFWGLETVRGYSRLSIPLSGGVQTYVAPIILPKSVYIWAAMIDWILDRSPELRDPKVLADGTKFKGLKTESYGELKVRLQTVSRGCRDLGMDWGKG